jgi:hypothetical protein
MQGSKSIKQSTEKTRISSSVSGGRDEMSMAKPEQKAINRKKRESAVGSQVAETK